MKKRAIVLLNDPILRKTAATVNPKDITANKIQNIIKNMSEILHDTKDGIGLAAPQIGISMRIFLASEEALCINRYPEDYNNPDKDDKLSGQKKWKHFVFINPNIIKLSKKRTKSVEGCLSIPQKYGSVPRPEKVKVRAYDENGNIFERGASGLFARLLQHEIDHLEGVLYIDKAEKIIDVKKDDKPKKR